MFLVFITFCVVAGMGILCVVERAKADGRKGDFYKYISDLDSMQEEEKKKEVAAANTSSENRETDKYNPGASVVKVEEEEKA